ncbi:MAG: GNAT family N-acetyltransferase [Acidimicrobiia bacterium]
MESTDDLETGYGPAAPAGDNLCNDYAQGLAEAFRSLAEARGDRVLQDEDLMLSDGGSASPFGNVAVLRRPVGSTARADVASRMHDFYRRRPGGPFILFSAWPTGDLRGADFGRIGHPPLMFRPPGPIDGIPIDGMPVGGSVGGSVGGLVHGLEIRPVTDAETARDWEHTLVHGYPEPALQPFEAGCFLPDTALSAPRWRHWVGYQGGAPVATASAFVGDHHVDVEFVSTLDSARGAGVGRALTATATLADPALPAMLISSDLGRGVYQRLGYLPLLRFTLWAGRR